MMNLQLTGAKRVPVGTLETRGQRASRLIHYIHIDRGRAMDHESEDAFERLRTAGYL